MLLKFEKNKDFKGIHFIDGEKKISLLADDTSLILDVSGKSLQNQILIF